LRRSDGRDLSVLGAGQVLSGRGAHHRVGGRGCPVPVHSWPSRAHRTTLEPARGGLHQGSLRTSQTPHRRRCDRMLWIVERDAADVSSRLSDRRPRARGGEEAASMLTVAGDEIGGAAIDGRSLLDEIAREGAHRMLVAALETEVAAYLHAHVAERDADGHALVVRNGRGRTRKVTLGGGTIAVNAPRINDRRVGTDGQRFKFTSRIL